MREAVIRIYAGVRLVTPTTAVSMLEVVPKYQQLTGKADHLEFCLVLVLGPF